MLVNVSRRTSAFTLVEILVVVVILGIASVIVLPSLGGRGDINAAAAARVLMADLVYAQNLSIVKQKPHFVRFEGQTYSLWTRDSGSLVRVKHPVRNEDFIVTFGAGGTSGLENVAFGEISIGGQPDIGFDELGSPLAANASADTVAALASSASFTITSGNDSVIVRVEPFTGEVGAQ
jgi:prepilin-type N-terminal cleavage/methylation domain-containing protein